MPTALPAPPDFWFRGGCTLLIDPESGEIRFGDGQHGAIPPIGTDSIVAFRYKRTELGNAAGGEHPLAKTS